MNPKQLLEFGQRLRRRREAQNMTRSKLCALAGITRTTLRYLESGTQHPSPATLQRLVTALQTTEELLTGHTPVKADDPLLEHLGDEDLEVAQAFHHAPTRVKQRVLGALQERGRKPALGSLAGEFWRRFEKLDADQKQLVTMMIDELQQKPATDVSTPTAPVAPKTVDPVRRSHR